PGAILEVSINQEAWDALPEDLQDIVKSACGHMDSLLGAEYSARNAQFLQQLRNEGRIEIRPFPDSVIAELRLRSQEVIDELVARDESAARIYASYTAFQQQVNEWLDIGERAAVAARG
ncbi:MAG: ABC transporter substrate-binding protein, partial [Chromatiales bacterium]|nr:ABC transporter substrate-binding protein [Chromatiales bacterium]